MGEISSTNNAGITKESLYYTPSRVALAPHIVGQRVRAALRDLRDGATYGTKAVLEPTTEELRALLGDAAETAYVEGERPNWKLSTLVSHQPLLRRREDCRIA